MSIGELIEAVRDVKELHGEATEWGHLRESDVDLETSDAALQRLERNQSRIFNTAVIAKCAIPCMRMLAISFGALAAYFAYLLVHWLLAEMPECDRHCKAIAVFFFVVGLLVFIPTFWVCKVFGLYKVGCTTAQAWRT